MNVGLPMKTLHEQRLGSWTQAIYGLHALSLVQPRRSRH